VSSFHWEGVFTTPPLGGIKISLPLHISTACLPKEDARVVQRKHGLIEPQRLTVSTFKHTLIIHSLSCIHSCIHCLFIHRRRSGGGGESFDIGRIKTAHADDTVSKYGIVTGLGHFRIIPANQLMK